MKNVMKKIVSSITSIVLGFSMLTASQVFVAAKDEYLTFEGLDDIYKDFINLSDSLLLTVVEDKGESTCMEGMATDGKYIYVAKINPNNNSNVRIFRYDKDGGNLTVLKRNIKDDYIGSGHANDMTAVSYKGDTYLFILNGSKIQKLKINQKDKTVEECGTITIEGHSFSGLAAETASNHSINKDKMGLYLKVADHIYKVEINMSQKNETIKKGNVKTIIDNWKSVWNGSDGMKKKLDACARQGIAYYGSSTCHILYMVYSDKEGKNKGDNYIVEYNLDSKSGENRIFNVHKVTSEGIKKNFELESCVIIGTTTHYNTNASFKGHCVDGIYSYFK